jgi:hypothetical protein
MRTFVCFNGHIKKSFPLGSRYLSTEKNLGGEKIKKAILLSLALVGSALSTNVFVGPEYAKELCEAQV